MKMKYAWCITNVVASAASVIFLLASFFADNDEISKDDDYGKAVLLMVALLILAAMWFYKAMKIWRKAIESDDPAFAAAIESVVEDTEERPSREPVV